MKDCWHYHDHETPVERAARRTSQRIESELVDDLNIELRMKREVREVPHTDLHNGDEQRDRRKV